MSAHPLPEDEGDELWQGELSAPAPGLADEAVEPLQAEAAEPGGGAGDAAGQVVEHAADADGDDDAQVGELLAVGGDPEVLARVAEGDEQRVRLGVMQVLCDLRPIGRGRRTGMGAGDDDAGMIGAQPRGGRCGDTGRGPEQEEPWGWITLLGEGGDQIVAGDAPTGGDAEDTAGQHNADAIRRGECGIPEHSAEAAVPTGGDGELRVDGDDVPECAGRCAEPSADERTRAGETNSIDRDSEDPAAWVARRFR